MRRYLEAGRLNSPRGLKGEIRFDCWCDDISFLSGVKYLYFDKEGKRPVEVKEIRETLSTVVFVGYEDRASAAALTGRTVYFDRNDITLPEGVFFNDDLIGLMVIDAKTGKQIGKLVKIEEGVASELYYIEGDKNYIIPAVKEFVLDIDLQKGITVNIIDGSEV